MTPSGQPREERSIGIIGAGLTGLTAAYDLIQRGFQVTIYEARSYTGGLAAGFRDDNWEWHLDRFYHHLFASDEDIIALIDELGARDRLFFRRPTTSVYYEGRLYPLDSPVASLQGIQSPSLHRAMRMLQFTPLSLFDRLRAGLAGVYLTLTRDWQRLERVTADEWMRRAVGERAYQVLWRPLLISKFGEAYYRQVNMAWMWARIHKRTASLGYFEGGFQALADLLAHRVQAQGGTLYLNTAIRSIQAVDDGLILELPRGTITHDHVLSTCSPQTVCTLTPALPADYASQLANLQSIGAVALILALRHSLTDEHYWINLPKGKEIPFMGLVEHTNYVNRSHYGGDHLVYCGDYLPPGHHRFASDKDSLLASYMPGLRQINPNFSPEWVRRSWKVDERYAQPVPFINHSQHIPPLMTPLKGLWMANMSQIYPWDRGTNYAVALGRRVAQMIAAQDKDAVETRH
jgi:protoporphyrinogen oxidase